MTHGFAAPIPMTVFSEVHIGIGARSPGRGSSPQSGRASWPRALSALLKYGRSGKLWLAAPAPIPYYTTDFRVWRLRGVENAPSFEISLHIAGDGVGSVAGKGRVQS